VSDDNQPAMRPSGQTNNLPAVEPTIVELAEHLAKMNKGTETLDTVLATLLQAFADKGVRPTPHLAAAQESLKRSIAGAEDTLGHIQSRLNMYQKLVRTTALITSSLDLDVVLDEVMDTVVHLTGAERAYLMLYDENKELKVRAARNWDQKTLSESEIGLSRSVIDAAINEAQAIITTNAQQDARFETVESIVVQKLRSIICIPLQIRGNTVGILYADNRMQRGVFQEGMVPLLTAFGAQAAIAIRNAQQFGEVKESLKEAERMIEDLRIVIDQGRVDKAVSEITDSEYFQTLAANAQNLRDRTKKTNPRGDTDA
jgi:transcriptional regulator with GAF, ATPase, and Fis domain